MSLSFKNYIEFYAPQHKSNNVDTTFLEWLVGFFEAEGCFLKWPDSKGDNRFGIEITQKDAKLIYKIKTELGFGNVTKITKKESGETYWRYYAHNLKALMRWIALLNGNLIAERRQAVFNSWLADFKKSKNKNIPLLPNKAKISLENAWLSGFFEGDAGFAVRQKVLRVNKKDGAKRYDIKTRFYLIQKEETPLLNQIKKLLKIPTKINIVTNGRTKEPYNRIETARLDCHLIIIRYLTRYPFKGQRHINFCIWERICAYRTKDYPVTEKSIVKLQRLASMLGKHCTPSTNPWDAPIQIEDDASCHAMPLPLPEGHGHGQSTTSHTNQRFVREHPNLQEDLYGQRKGASKQDKEN